MAKQEEETKLIKVHVPVDVHDQVKLAAALRRMGIGDFAREAVVKEAKRVTAGVKFKD